jgi:hypothetical protein
VVCCDAGGEAVKNRKIIPLVDKSELENNERIFRRSISKKRSYEAWFAASCWIRFISDIKQSKLTARDKRGRREMLMFDFVNQIFGAVKTRDGQFFRDFAYFLERQGQVESKVRLWLAEKHFARDINGVPKHYTHTELLDDAQCNGIELDERQLRRLMKESHFTFKHSHCK